MGINLNPKSETALILGWSIIWMGASIKNPDAHVFHSVRLETLPCRGWSTSRDIAATLRGRAGWYVPVRGRT